jgi:KaiC/GvpD/RAD55 family RecA-like ATPase
MNNSLSASEIQSTVRSFSGGLIKYVVEEEPLEGPTTYLLSEEGMNSWHLDGVSANFILEWCKKDSIERSSNNFGKMVQLKAFEFNKELCLHKWIEINGSSGSGKSTLSQHIVSIFDSNNFDNVSNSYIFTSTIGGGLFPGKAKEMEESIYFLLRKLQAGNQFPSGLLLVIEELDRFFEFVSNPSLLRSVILELLMNLKRWKITFVTTRQSYLEEWNQHKRITYDSVRLQVTLGNRALKIASEIWGTTDIRYLWLSEQKHPCIICDEDSINVAIVPEIQTNKPNKEEDAIQN